MSSTHLLSWGRYPPVPQAPTECYWRHEIPNVLARMHREHGTTLAHGSGMSYGDSCLAASNHVVHMPSLNRFIRADWSSGTLVAEAGVTLAEILSVTIPRGWFLPVTPGTKHVTLGGAIANDVHGKNHHRRGTFGRHVRRFALVRSDSGSQICSQDENKKLYQATIGGLGLTGIIEWAEIVLTPIASGLISQTTERFNNLDEFFALSDELDEKHEFCVSWIDCVAKTKMAGRGIYMAGDFANHGPRAEKRRRNLMFPFTPPVSLVNGVSLRAFNELYWHKGPKTRQKSETSCDRFFYPLDAILKWNRMYGPNGFQQYQAVIPEREAKGGIQALLATIAEAGTGSFLAVIKRCGDVPSPGLLSFPLRGTTLALDFPQTAHLQSALFSRLDAIVRETGGRIYPAKDAHMTADDFQRCYPRWNEVEALRDPVLMSHFWKRVTQ